MGNREMRIWTKRERHKTIKKKQMTCGQAKEWATKRFINSFAGLKTCDT